MKTQFDCDWIAVQNVFTFYYCYNICDVFSVFDDNKGEKEHTVRQKRTLVDGSGLEFYYSFAIPLDLPNKSVTMQVYFGSNYGMPGPDNILYDWQNGFPVVKDDTSEARRRNKKRRSTNNGGFDRAFAYRVVETKLETHGVPGRPCLLRAICEVASSDLEHNGLLGELIYIALTPSSSKEEGLQQEFYEAERQGQENYDCSSYFKNCKISILDLITWMGI